MRAETLRRWVRFGLMAGLSLAMVGSSAAAQKGDGLRVYFADVEGGQATLFVTPEGESLMVDAGWPGFNDRDADRIVALCKQAGVTRIDNLLVTHYHTDHVGGVPQLAAKIPIGRFIDHGDNTETRDPATLRGWAAYQKVLADSRATRLVVKAGDLLPIKGMRASVVSANGEVIDKALSGGGAGARNAACATSAQKEPENSENDRSIGLMIAFGNMRLLDLGDLTWAEERPLMCPVDKLGKVDVYVASHHGFNRSGSPALLGAIEPRVVVIDNGGHKGAEAEAWTIIEGTPRLKDMWQLHTAEAAGAHNVPDARIANLAGTDAGHAIELTARRDGSLSVTNGRTGETVAYPAP
jgi:competence protein ComEC